MKKPLVRIIAIILAVLSLTSVFPLSVFASSEGTGTEKEGKLIGAHR